MAVERIVIVTPEHVEIELVPAGMGRRFLAWLADFILIFGIRVAASLSCMLLGVTLGTFLAITLMFIILWGYHIFFDVFAQGRSLGKRMLGLRVVDDRGLPVSLRQSFVRNVVRIVDMQPGIFHGVGALACLLDRHARRLGDLAAGTIVVHETKPLAAPRQLTEGRQYNSLRTPQVQRLIRNRIGLEEREFLLTLSLRAASLDDKARFDLMDDAGEHFRRVLAIDDAHMSGENLVRGLTAVLFEKQAK